LNHSRILLALWAILGPQMKYHYQPVSRTAVRIEVIPEDPKESSFLNSFEREETLYHQDLIACYEKGLEAYNTDAILRKTTFMQFPRVALCNFEPAQKTIEQLI
jgi:hypothetical protein